MTRHAPARPRRHRAPAAAPLLRLADLLHAAFAADGWGQPAHLVRVVGPPDARGEGEGELGLLPIDDGWADVLRGFVAPDDWWAVGLITGGVARALPPDADGPRTEIDFLPGPDLDGLRVRLVHLVARDGQTASAIGGEGGRLAHRLHWTRHAKGPRPMEGRVDDTLHRVLGLATGPPQGCAATVWALAWLDALVVSAARGHRLRDWETVAARHPLVEQRQAANPDAAVPTPADLALLGRSTRSRATWDTARSACVNGELAVPGIDSALAAWMDAGMFSRDVPLMFPDAPDLVTTAVELVPDEVRDAVEMVAAAFGVTR